MTPSKKTAARRLGRPPTGRALSAAERMRRLRARRKAAGLRPVVEWRVAEPGAVAPYSRHRLAEARSLAMHSVIAHRLVRDPSVLDRARRNLARWEKAQVIPRPAWLGEWRMLLSAPREELAALISEPSERGARLRQSSPFAGVLSRMQRKKIYDAFRT